MDINGKNIFITGIDTDIGKTIVSSIFTKAFEADYWKPIQCGDLENSDTMKVEKLVGPGSHTYHPESYKLKMPASPHLAASKENIDIKLSNIKLPATKKSLIIEGAGGCLVPLNKTDWVIDLPLHLGLSTVVVFKHYLGSLNHTFQTLEAIRQRGLIILGLVLNGDDNEELTQFIQEKTNLPILLKVKQEKELNPEVIETYAKELRERLDNGFSN